MKTFLKKLLGWAIVAVSICFIIWIFFSYESIIGVFVGTVVLILGVTVIHGASDEDYNSNLTKIKRISETHGITFEKMYNDFKNLDTPLGKPWIGRAAWNVKQSMVYGPFKDNDLVYVYLKRGKCYISGTGMEDLKINTPEVQAHKLTFDESELSKNQLVCFHLMNNLSVAQMHTIMQDYFKTGKAIWNDNISWKDAKAYAFTEEFKLTGQDFRMTDMDNNELYKIKGTYPLKTLYFYDSKNQKEVFKVEKKILHVLPHYDFYDENKLIGNFEQKANISRDVFKMETEMGLFEVKQDLDNFGAGHTVYLNGKMIGAIAKRLNLSLQNLIFDNFIFWTIDNRYRLLMAAFTVMIAREIVRDRNGIA
ncbi:MAG: hypothetical protein MJ188_09480 [Treponema sp.]|nr:hypothetical protein [Treponema sp.]